MRDFRKPIPQGPGWACFYCDEVFLTQGEAEDHFGFFGETVDNSDPGCVQALTYGEKALRAALMEMYRELDAEREVSHELQNVVESLEGIRPDLERLFDGASTPHQAWLKMDSVEGRALAAEAIIAAIAKRAPHLVAAAREEVCRIPGTEPKKRTLLGRLACAVGLHEMERLPSPPGVMSGHGAPHKCRRGCGTSWEGLRIPDCPKRPS